MQMMGMEEQEMIELHQKLADVPEAFDISHIFAREAERLDEAMAYTTQGIDTLSMQVMMSLK